VGPSDLEPARTPPSTRGPGRGRVAAARVPWPSARRRRRTEWSVPAAGRAQRSAGG